MHSNRRDLIPPFFIFTKCATGRDVKFRGIAIPGAKNLSSSEDLIAIWKLKSSSRFQNYRASFTILDLGILKREWINDLENGVIDSMHVPPLWTEWKANGVYFPLVAERAIEHRTKTEQIPDDDNGKKIIETIYNYFTNGYAFEKCAAELVKIMDPKVVMCDLTRPWVDGGRDAIGKYRIGLPNTFITTDFAIEAKRYEINNSVGVKEIARLISRIRHREFGILVTTSYVHHQAYKEIKDDGHPIIIVSAIDILQILKKIELDSDTKVYDWLKSNFSRE